jgi:hypothetical protein
MKHSEHPSLTSKLSSQLIIGTRPEKAVHWRASLLPQWPDFQTRMKLLRIHSVVKAAIVNAANLDVLLKLTNTVFRCYDQVPASELLNCNVSNTRLRQAQYFDVR